MKSPSPYTCMCTTIHVYWLLLFFLKTCSQIADNLTIVGIVLGEIFLATECFDTSESKMENAQPSKR